MADQSDAARGTNLFVIGLNPADAYADMLLAFSPYPLARRQPAHRRSRPLWVGMERSALVRDLGGGDEGPRPSSCTFPSHPSRCTAVASDFASLGVPASPTRPGSRQLEKDRLRTH